jgi:hypothetical protein
MRRAQAAMEFLLTYGWAILVVIVAVGALAYFGVLSPEKSLPNSCEIGAPFSCFDAEAVNDAVFVAMRYGGSSTLTYMRIEVAGCGNVSTDFTQGDIDGSTGKVIGAYVPCAITATKSRYKGDVKIYYQQIGGQINQTATGYVSTGVRQEESTPEPVEDSQGNVGGTITDNDGNVNAIFWNCQTGWTCVLPPGVGVAILPPPQPICDPKDPDCML